MHPGLTDVDWIMERIIERMEPTPMYLSYCTVNTGDILLCWAAYNVSVSVIWISVRLVSLSCNHRKYHSTKYCSNHRRYNLRNQTATNSSMFIDPSLIHCHREQTVSSISFSNNSYHVFSSKKTHSILYVQQHTQKPMLWRLYLYSLLISRYIMLALNTRLS